MKLGEGIWPCVERFIPPQCLDEIAASASESDSTGQISERVLELLKLNHYYGIPVPSDFEGEGATVEQCCAVQRRIAMADPGLAVGLNMHLFSVGVILEHWRVERDVSWALMEAIATQDRLVASAFAEPGLGGSFLRSHCQGKRVEGGYQVTGVKAPCSLIARSDLVCFQFESNENRPDTLCVALVPTKSEGFSVKKSWNAMGMRASESDTLLLSDAFVPDDLVFHRSEPGADDDPVFTLGLCWFLVTATATYLGAINACLHQLTKQLEGSAYSKAGLPRGHYPTFQNELGELFGQYLALEHSCSNIAKMLDREDRTVDHILPSALALKNVAVDTCKQVSGSAMELCGGGSYSTKSPMSRLWRDIQAIAFHPPTRFVSRQILARSALGFPIRFELNDAASID